MNGWQEMTVWLFGMFFGTIALVEWAKAFGRRGGDESRRDR